MVEMRLRPLGQSATHEGLGMVRPRKLLCKPVAWEGSPSWREGVWKCFDNRRDTLLVETALPFDEVNITPKVSLGNAKGHFLESDFWFHRFEAAGESVVGLSARRGKGSARACGLRRPGEGLSRLLL